MKKNVKLTNDHERSSYDVIMENLQKLDLNIDDIAGLFYQSNDEYEKTFDYLTDYTKLHDDMITNICLAKVFHKILVSPSVFEDPKNPPRLDLLTQLASELPFSRHILTTEKPYIRLEVLQRSFGALYGEQKFWKNPDVTVTVKFSLWKFAHTINRIYNDELYIINLDLIEKTLCVDEKQKQLFQEMKTEYVNKIQEEYIEYIKTLTGTIENDDIQI